MKALPPALATHIAQELTTLAYLLRITRSDGTTYAYTTHDTELTLGGTTYRADAGFQASQLESQQGLAPDNLETLGLLSDDGITAADIAAGRFDNASVWLSVCNWQSPGDGTILLRRGQLGAITRQGSSYRFELKGLLDRLQQTVGETCTRQCRYHLGEPRCGIDLTSAVWRKTGKLTTTPSALTLVDSTRTEAKDFFTNGTLTMTSGVNAGLLRAIKSYSGGGFGLWEAFPQPCAIGDSYAATAGCDKLFTTCQIKFANTLNFGGFPHLPGADALLTTPEPKS